MQRGESGGEWVHVASEGSEDGVVLASAGRGFDGGTSSNGSCGDGGGVEESEGGFACIPAGGTSGHCCCGGGGASASDLGGSWWGCGRGACDPPVNVEAKYACGEEARAESEGGGGVGEKLLQRTRGHGDAAYERPAELVPDIQALGVAIAPCPSPWAAC